MLVANGNNVVFRGEDATLMTAKGETAPLMNAGDDWYLKCKDNTSNDPFFAMQKCATIWLQMKLTITGYSLTTSAQMDYKIQTERTLHLVLRLRGETERQDARHQ